LHPFVPGELYGEEEKTDQQAAEEYPHSTNHLYYHWHNDHPFHDPCNDRKLTLAGIMHIRPVV
jgi:hypothetical protein